jgi:hypothetical protein
LAFSSPRTFFHTIAFSTSSAPFFHDHSSNPLGGSLHALHYVEVIWSAYGINYDQRVSLSPGESAAFPVLPTYVEVRVGNTNWFSGATQTVSIEYYY